MIEKQRAPYFYGARFQFRRKWLIVLRRRALRLCAEFILLNLNGGPALLEARDTAAGDKLQLALIVQLSGPTDGQLQALARKQDLVSRKQNARAADVDGFPGPLFLAIPLVEDLVFDISLDRKTIRAAPFDRTVRATIRNWFREQRVSLQTQECLVSGVNEIDGKL